MEPARGGQRQRQRLRSRHALRLHGGICWKARQEDPASAPVGGTGWSSHVDPGSPSSCSPVPGEPPASKPGGWTALGDSVSPRGVLALLGGRVISIAHLPSRRKAPTCSFPQDSLGSPTPRRTQARAISIKPWVLKQTPGLHPIFPRSPLWSRPEPPRHTVHLGFPSTLPFPFLEPVPLASDSGPLHVLPLCPQQVSQILHGHRHSSPHREPDSLLPAPSHAAHLGTVSPF